MPSPRRVGRGRARVFRVVGAAFGVSQQAERKIRGGKWGRAGLRLRYVFCLFRWRGVATLGVHGRLGDREGEAVT